jgi:hypothetical protein
MIQSVQLKMDGSINRDCRFWSDFRQECVKCQHCNAGNFEGEKDCDLCVTVCATAQNNGDIICLAITDNLGDE